MIPQQVKKKRRCGTELHPILISCLKARSYIFEGKANDELEGEANGELDRKEEGIGTGEGGTWAWSANAAKRS